MKIVGFGIKKLFGERNDVSNIKLSISQNINVKDVYKEKLDLGIEDSITIKFVFSVNYSENFGKVEIEGNVLILPDKEESKEFAKALKEKNIPERFKTPIFNFIMSKCNIKALSLEDELNLPYHVPMPKLSPREQNDSLN